MKRTFLTRRNALLVPGKLSWGSGILGVTLLLLTLRLMAPDLWFRLFAPVFRSAVVLADASHLVFSNFSDRGTLAVANEQLQSENTKLLLENRSLSDKMARIQGLLDSASITKWSALQVLADVIAHPPESAYDTLLLSKGAREGVTRGMGAFVPSIGQENGGLLPVGVVTFVTADFSRITLMSSPGVQTPGWVGTAHTPITLIGLGGGALGATVARAAQVSVADSIFGVGVGTPVLGTVIRVDSDPSSPEVVIRILPTINPFSISEVLLRDVGTAFRRATSTESSTPL